VTTNLLFVRLLQADVLVAYDAAESALREAERSAPTVAPSIRRAVDALFAARVALDEGAA
jgi:Tfp pilus assembly protein PilX